MTDPREALAETIRAVTDLWDEPLDEVRDVPQITDAILAEFDVTPRGEGVQDPRVVAHIERDANKALREVRRLARSGIGKDDECTISRESLRQALRGEGS